MFFMDGFVLGAIVMLCVAIAAVLILIVVFAPGDETWVQHDQERRDRAWDEAQKRDQSDALS